MSLNPRQFQGSLLLSLLLLSAIPSFGQLNHGGSPLHWGAGGSDVTDWKEFAALDAEALNAEDAQTAKFKDAPWRFGIEHSVNWNTANAGSWSNEDGFDVWRIGVHGKQATSWSFYLSEFQIPKNGVLFVWNKNRTAFLGAFTHENQKEWGGLAIGLLEGESVVLEYRQPERITTEPQIEVSQVVQGYRSLLTRASELQNKSSQGPFGNSGACNINVNCPEGADWQIEKKAVALIVNGGFASCTGSLINNTANDETPYFLTANHCLGNPNTWTYYFNHESATCSGNTGPTNMSISGGSLLVANGGSDVALIELSSAPPASWDVEYAGWDASGATPANATGIHHPSGDLKKICFEEDSPYPSTSGGAQVWWIDAWEDGVTEPGSSGSPLFDQNHRIIGQLYGGAAACSGSVNNGAFDYYGRFDVSWGLGISDYLDPQNTGALTLDGYPSGFNDLAGCTDPTACNYDPVAQEDDGSCDAFDACGICGGDDGSCSGCTDAAACNYDPEATLSDSSCEYPNPGQACSCATDFAFDITLSGTQAEEVILEATSNTTLQTVSITLDYSNSINAGYAIDLLIAICDPQGTCIEMGGFDHSVGYTAAGDWPTSWNTAASGTYTAELDVASFGLTGEGDWTIAYINGYSITNSSGTWVGTLTLDDLCLGIASGEIEGCTEASACNYDPTATLDDGSCTVNDACGICGGPGTDTDGDGIADCNEIAGCTDAAACNYLADATDSAACTYPDAGFDCSGEPVGCAEDLNGNGMVEVSDVLILLADFGCEAECSVADINGDGMVSVADVLLLLAAFGEEC